MNRSTPELVNEGLLDHGVQVVCGWCTITCGDVLVVQSATSLFSSIRIGLVQFDCSISLSKTYCMQSERAATTENSARGK